MRRVIGAVERGLKNVLRETPLRAPARALKERAELAHHVVAERVPAVVRPVPKTLFVSMTAGCNFRCKTCHYGRDFMPGHVLPWALGEPMLEDAAKLGVQSIRLYGGEPLLHPDLERYVRKICDLGLNQWVTTNGLLLRKKIDRLHAAGLRRLSLGFYGIGSDYDDYVGRQGAFAVVEEGIRYARSRYDRNALRIHLDWLLMRPTGDPKIVHETLDFARRYDAQIFVNLIHYSLPYFTTGARNQGFDFCEDDRPLLEDISERLVEIKRSEPDLVLNSETGLRSIPDWLIRREQMRIPCTEYEMVWVGPDGTVQMCYVTFPLGNLNDQRLQDILFTEAHRRAARGAFSLDCPNCHCSFDKRVLRNAAARRRYGAPA